MVDEKYYKHVWGEGKRDNEPPDMPEYQHEIDRIDGFDRYVKDAEDLMSGPPPEGVREVVRSSDGAILRMTPDGKLGIARDGKIVNFFRVVDDPMGYIENESRR